MTYTEDGDKDDDDDGKKNRASERRNNYNASKTGNENLRFAMRKHNDDTKDDLYST